MPNPRKRKLKRAVANVLTNNPLRPAMNDLERAIVKSRLTNKVASRRDLGQGAAGDDADKVVEDGYDVVRGILEIFSHSPAFGGNTHKNRNFMDGFRRASTRIDNGLIADISEMDTNAMMLGTIGNASPAIGDSIVLTDGTGESVRFVFGDIENAGVAFEAGANCDEVLPNPLLPPGDPNPGVATPDGVNFFNPRRFLVVIDANRLVTYNNFCLVVNAQIAIEANRQASALHLVQEIAGSAGNTAIITSQPVVGNELRIAETGVVDAPIEQLALWELFSGGANAQDAPHFYGELHRDDEVGQGNQTQITATHGVLFISNPSSQGLSIPPGPLPEGAANPVGAGGTGYGGISSIGAVTINPSIINPAGALVDGAGVASMILHIKAISGPSGGVVDDTRFGMQSGSELVAAASLVSNAAQSTMVAALTSATVQVADPVQAVFSGEQSIVVTTRTAVARHNMELSDDLLDNGAAPGRTDDPPNGLWTAQDTRLAVNAQLSGPGMIVHWVLSIHSPNA